MLEGTVDVISGYSGGLEEYPTYEQVSGGKTGHAEAITIFFDPKVISFETLLQVFFVAHDPTQLNRQGPDVGKQYRSAIFYHDEIEKVNVEGYINTLDRSGKFTQPIVTEVEAYNGFWVAESYHQDYYSKNPDNPYIKRVSRPKVEKVKEEFTDRLKGYSR